MVADYARLTEALSKAERDVVTYSWREFDEIVGGLPASAAKHYPQWWHGDRPNTMAWRKAGYERAAVEVGRSVTFRRTKAEAEPEPTSRSSAPAASGPPSLTGVDPRSALIVIGCSKRKARGGHPAGTEGGQDYWSDDLMGARKRLLARSAVDPRYVLPAWRRYTGTFYRTAGEVVGEAVEWNCIALLSRVTGGVDAPSDQWLGRHAVSPPVRESGLWNVNHIDEQYNPAFLEAMQSLLNETPPCARRSRSAGTSLRWECRVSGARAGSELPMGATHD